MSDPLICLGCGEDTRMCQCAKWERREPFISHTDREAISKAARAELRNRFAMAALTGLLAAEDHHAYNRDEMAVEAWNQADAMLKARGHE
jgi:hypothetical protein